jgi:hypothetical protein
MEQSKMETAAVLLAVTVLIVVGLVINMLPAIIAYQRKHRYRVAILVLNLFVMFFWGLDLGLMALFVSWLALLIWATTLAYAEPQCKRVEWT